MGCNFLLQFSKVKSESEVAQSCPTLSHTMDCSLPGLSVLGVFPGKSTVAGRHCLLLRRNNLPQTNDTSLTQKWMFTCHLVIYGPSYQDQQLRMRVPSPLCGAPFTQCFCLLQEPQPQHPTRHLQMGPNVKLEHQGALWSTILPKPSHP